MFFFWGPFFFVFPALIIFFIVRHFIAPPHRHQHRWYLDDFYDDFSQDYAQPQQQPESNQVKIYKLAYKLKGHLTVSDIVIETGLEVPEAEELIQSMVDNQRIRMEVDEDGMLVYEFPEIIARLERDDHNEKNT